MLEDYDYNFADDTTWSEARDHIHMDARKEWGREKLIAWLESHSLISDVSARSRAIDFLIGPRDVWPDVSDDEHLNAINRSSISMWCTAVPAMNELRFVDELTIHLPPAPEFLRDDIEAALNTEESLGVYYGTGALGGMPAPDGVITPHIIHDGENVTIETARAAIEDALRAYRGPYNRGDAAIKKQP